jgi:hypothetical protein
MLGEGSSHISEGICGDVLRRASPDWSLFQVPGVDPGDGGSGHAEMQMIRYRDGIAGLGMGAADLLFDLPETGLDTPSLTPL